MLDDQIDEVARQLTEGQAPADLRARVIARIDSHSEGRRWRMWPAAAALGGLALVLLSIRVMLPTEDGRTAIRENARTATQETVAPPIASGAATARSSILPEQSLAAVGAPGRAATAPQRPFALVGATAGVLPAPQQPLAPAVPTAVAGGGRALPPPVESPEFGSGVDGDLLRPPDSIVVEPLELEPLPAAESLAEDSIAVAVLDISPIETQITDRQ